AARALAGIIVAGIVADSWITSLPLLEPPRAWPPSVSTAGVASVVELPIGETLHDAAAMYRTLSTRLPTANGMSRHMPAHYPALQLGLEERDESVLDALGTHGPVLVAVEQKSPGANDTLSWLRDMSSARPIVQTDETSWFVVSASAAPAR